MLIWELYSSGYDIIFASAIYHRKPRCLYLANVLLEVYVAVWCNILCFICEKVNKRYIIMGITIFKIFICGGGGGGIIKI